MQPSRLIRARIRDQVRDILRELIVSGEIHGGEHLDEAGLSERIGASRTPIREALIALEEEGLVFSRPNQGFIATALDGRLVREIYPILGALEGAAVELGGLQLRRSAPRLFELTAKLARETRSRTRYALDREFHRMLSVPCENQRLLQLIEQHWNHARRIDGGERRGIANHEGSHAEHHAIVVEIERGKLAAAAGLLREHWRKGIDIVLRWMDTSK